MSLKHRHVWRHSVGSNAYFVKLSQRKLCSFCMRVQHHEVCKKRVEFAMQHCNTAFSHLLPVDRHSTDHDALVLLHVLRVFILVKRDQQSTFLQCNG